VSSQVEVRVPDIGDFDHVDVIDILVKPGDVIKPEDPLITLESEKATMDIPAPYAGTVVAISVAVGDQIGEGALILTLAPADAAVTETPESAPVVAAPAAPAASPAPAPAPAPTAAAPTASAPVASGASSTIEIRVPDIGDFDNVDVIDIIVKPGDTVRIEDPLLTVESEKATMDIPAPFAGVVESVSAAVGDKISEGDVIVVLRITESAAVAPAAPVSVPTPPVSMPKTPATRVAPAAPPEAITSSRAHASPSVRKFARELGVDIALVYGKGPKGRILKTDLESYVKEVMRGTRGHAAGAAAGGGITVPAAPVIDFTKFGEIEVTPLNKIRRLTGQNLHRSWVTVPHVFQMDEADITELEAFRKSKADEAEQKGTKLTLLAFLVKAAVVGLKKFPDFNASLSPDGEALVHKKYFHIGIAVNTDNGLMVPVIRDVDKKGLYELALEVRDLSKKARERKLMPAEMQGACFTISSLGGVGGTAFTPIINLPEVAILGVSPSAMKPVWRGNEFVPRLMLPFTLSYDHRVIDGVAAAQFTRYLTTVLGDIRHILL
jgi:pyruvate dehydrogenase E2 component (dihydrolipoamide acetyltransferase)